MSREGPNVAGFREPVFLFTDHLICHYGGRQDVAQGAGRESAAGENRRVALDKRRTEDYVSRASVVEPELVEDVDLSRGLCMIKFRSLRDWLELESGSDTVSSGWQLTSMSISG